MSGFVEMEGLEGGSRGGARRRGVLEEQMHHCTRSQPHTSPYPLPQGRPKREPRYAHNYGEYNTNGNGKWHKCIITITGKD